MSESPAQKTPTKKHRRKNAGAKNAGVPMPPRRRRSAGGARVQSSFKYRKIGAMPEGNHPTDDD
jgi:hypothetical protein